MKWVSLLIMKLLLLLSSLKEGNKEKNHTNLWWKAAYCFPWSKLFGLKQNDSVRGFWKIYILKGPAHAHFHFHTFTWGIYLTQTHYFLIIISINRLSVHSVLVPVSLRPASWQFLVCSDWSALMGLSRHRPRCVRIRCVSEHVQGVGAVTVQLWHHSLPEVLMAPLNAVSEQRLCAFLRELSVFILSQYSYSTQSCWEEKKSESHFLNYGTFKRFLLNWSSRVPTL